MSAEVEPKAQVCSYFLFEAFPKTLYGNTFPIEFQMKNKADIKEFDKNIFSCNDHLKKFYLILKSSNGVSRKFKGFLNF